MLPAESFFTGHRFATLDASRRITPAQRGIRSKTQRIRGVLACQSMEAREAWPGSPVPPPVGPERPGSEVKNGRAVTPIRSTKTGSICKEKGRLHAQCPDMDLVLYVI